MAREIPVLPDVGSRMTLPGRNRPSASAASIIRRAIRSFSEPVGFWPSSFAHIWTEGFGDRRWIPTRGVSPMAPRISSARIASRLWQRRPTGPRSVLFFGLLGYPSTMFRRLALASVPLVILFGSACTSGPSIVVVPPAPTTPATTQTLPEGSFGFAAIAQPFFQYIFAPQEVLDGEIQAPPTLVRGATLRLKALVDDIARLKITALPSTHGTVALGFQESSSVKDRWGDIMIPAQRKLFGRFASDPSLGNWLIILDDVIVTDGKDPIPLTAYRWNRSAVEAYADCGIPPLFVIDDCTHAFYGESEIAFLIGPGNNAGQ
jgi:hypothetical protein